MEDASLLLSALKSLLKKRNEVINSSPKLISSVNDLSSAILAASHYSMRRMNEALFAKSKKDKLKILESLSDEEMEKHARMNEMCAPITDSSRLLQRPFSKINLDRKLGNKKQLEAVLRLLTHGEVGLQKLLAGSYDVRQELASKTKTEIDDYIHGRRDELKRIQRHASDIQFRIGDCV